MDTEFDDVASAITLAWARDGQNRPSANLNMGGYRLTNTGAAASAEDFLRVKEFIRDVPVYVKDKNGGAGIVQVSTTFYASVSAGQSPPDGARLKVLASGSFAAATATMYLYSPLGTSAGASPHKAPIWTRGQKFDPNSIRPKQIYDFVYDASASAWRCLNPSRSFFSAQTRAKAKDSTGLVAGRASASTNMSFSRHGSQLTVQLGTSVSVSCSISAQYLVLSCSGVTSLTSGFTGAIGPIIPISIKDAASTFWSLRMGTGQQIESIASFPGATTTVSVACTIRAAPFTAILLATS